MAVGQEIIAYCSSCKLDLRHVIVAHKAGNSGAVAKLRCNTCSKIHTPRINPEARSASAGAKTRAPTEKKRVIPLEVEWREQLSKLQGKPSLPYVPQRDFKVDDVIDHPQFGCGIVRAMKDGNKFEVLFQREIKVLIHRLKPEVEENI